MKLEIVWCEGVDIEAIKEAKVPVRVVVKHVEYLEGKLVMTVEPLDLAFFKR